MHDKCRFLMPIGRRLIGAVAAGLVMSLGGCGGGSYPAPPSGSATTPSSDVVDGYDYSADTPVPLQNVQVTILPPKAGGSCRDKAGTGFGPAVNGKKDYSGCTLAMVNAGVKDNGCPAVINGQPTISDTDFKPYVRVLFSADGYTPDQSLMWNGQMKLNGHSTRCASQQGYEIDLGAGLTDAQAALVEPFNGMMSVLLKKHPYDLTRIRNSLSFYLFRSVPDLVSRPTWLLHASFTDTSGDPATQAYLSNQCAATGTPGTSDCGLFEDIEEDDSWLTSHKLDPNGQFWEAQNFTFEPVTENLLPPNTPDSDAFQTTIEPMGTGYDATDLLNMLDAVNDGLSSIGVDDYTNDFETVFSQYFHPDNFRAWLATNILVNNDDTNSQNFYLYKPSNSTHFYFAPWDYDGAWDWYNQIGSAPFPTARWTQGVSNWWGMTLVRRYLMAPGEVEQLTDKVNQLRNTVFSDSNIQNAINTGLPMAQINAIETELPDSAFPDAGHATASQRQAEIARLPATVQKALAEYNVSLLRPMPLFQNPQVQNGALVLDWDPSYSIAGNPLVYDVVLATSPAMGGTDSNCTGGDSAVPQLSNGIVFSTTGYSSVQIPDPNGGASPALPALATGTPYYLQVIARDAKTGYCQIAFDSFTDPANSNAIPAFGVFGFTSDGNNTVTQIGD